MTHNHHTTEDWNQDALTKDLNDYLAIVRHWDDPNPAPVIERVELGDKHVYVVRDDLLKVGSKSRFADFFVQNHKANVFVYAQPRVGYAGITLCSLANKYDKKVVLFVPEAKDQMTPHIQRCKDDGAELYFKRIYGMAGLRKAAKDYVDEANNKFGANTLHVYVPPGLRGIPEITAAAVKVAHNMTLPEDVSEVWSVVSTGMLSRALQIAWPTLPFNAVAVARNMHAGEIGRAKMYSHPFPFMKDELKEHLPPFPCAKNYDAKAWRFIKEHAKPGALFWNVAGE
jgi:hypothetical protein